MELKGIGVSPGVAMGQALVVEREAVFEAFFIASPPRFPEACDAGIGEDIDGPDA